MASLQAQPAHSPVEEVNSSSQEGAGCCHVRSVSAVYEPCLRSRCVIKTLRSCATAVLQSRVALLHRSRHCDIAIAQPASPTDSPKQSCVAHIPVIAAISLVVSPMVIVQQAMFTRVYFCRDSSCVGNVAYATSPVI